MTLLGAEKVKFSSTVVASFVATSFSGEFLDSEFGLVRSLIMNDSPDSGPPLDPVKLMSFTNLHYHDCDNRPDQFQLPGGSYSKEEIKLLTVI